MKTLSLMLLLALAAPVLALAAGGALEINQDCAQAGCFAGDGAGFPVTITQPGSYVLTSDLVVSSVVDAIEIQASPVDLDLNGHSLNGGGTCTGTPVTTCSGAVSSDGVYLNATSASGHIRVHNGTVRGFGNSGIEGGETGDGLLLEHLTIVENASNGIALGNNSYTSTAQVRDSVLARNRPSGLYSFVRVDVENCIVFGNYSYGLNDEGGGTIANSRFENNGSEGIVSSQSNAVALDHNVFHHNDNGSAQWTLVAGTLFDMGGNICTNHACP